MLLRGTDFVTRDADRATESRRGCSVRRDVLLLMTLFGSGVRARASSYCGQQNTQFECF